MPFADTECAAWQTAFAVVCDNTILMVYIVSANAVLMALSGKAVLEV